MRNLEVTDEQLDLVIRMYNQGEVVSRIVERTGLTRYGVDKIINTYRSTDLKKIDNTRELARIRKSRAEKPGFFLYGKSRIT